MRILELSANKKSFKTLTFNPEGISLIVGGHPSRYSDRSNGVGKTLALKLVNLCLGARADKKMGEVLKDWFFELKFEVAGKIHHVTRSADGKIIYLDDHKMNIQEYRNWLNDLGVFLLPNNNFPISFRSLFRRFTRVARNDCIDPIRLSKENDFQALINSLWLLGFDIVLAKYKYDIKKQIEAIDKQKKSWETEHPVLKNIFNIGSDPHAKAEQLKEQIELLRKHIQEMHVADDYYDLVQQADILTKKLRKIETEISRLEFRLEKIGNLMRQTPDISLEELNSLYKEMKQIFRPEILRHFEAVEKFHKTLYEQRITRLENERIKTLEEKQRLENEWQEIKKERDSLIDRLKGSTSLEEYQTILGELSKLEEELKVIQRYLEVEQTLQKKRISLQKEFTKAIEKASKYLDTTKKRQEFLDKKYRDLAKKLYDNISAGLQIKLNDGFNLILYNIIVTIEGQSSDGINDARILCFDWLIYMWGQNHSMRFLWHDNRLFANLERRARANWFKIVLESLKATGKQYIASLNQENYEAMLDYFSDEEKEIIEDSVILRLDANKPEQKLLGIQFDL